MQTDRIGWVERVPSPCGYYKVVVLGKQVDTALFVGRAKRRLQKAVTEQLKWEIKNAQENRIP